MRVESWLTELPAEFIAGIAALLRHWGLPHQEDDVQEILQSARVIVFSRLQAGRTINDTRAYAFGVVVNLARMAVRRRRAHREVSLEALAIDPESPGTAPLEDPAFEGETIAAFLREVVSEMPDSQRRTAVATFLEGKTPVQYSEESGLALSSVYETHGKAEHRIQEAIRRRPEYRDAAAALNFKSERRAGTGARRRRLR